MDQFKNFEMAVSNLNHQVQKLKKDHKEEKAELLKQLKEYRDRETFFKNKIQDHQTIIENYKNIVNNLEQ